MADITIDQLPEDASPTTDDAIHTVNDPTGSPTDRYTTIANLATTVFTAKDTDDLGEGSTNLYNKVPSGGTANQVLSKVDGTDYNLQWANSSAPVDSVNGQTGVVVLDTDDVSEGSTNKYITSTTPQLGGDLDENDKGFKVVGQTVGGSDGDVVYLSGANTWSQADASAEATCKDMLAIRLSATEIITRGVYTTSGLTAGALYYVSETAGSITTTAPTTSLSIVRPIGYALSTTQLYVDPDKTWVEIQ